MSKTYKIESGIPVPDRKGRGGGKSKWYAVIEPMGVGDVIWVETRGEVHAVATYSRKLGRKVTVRKQDNGTFGIWRAL